MVLLDIASTGPWPGFAKNQIEIFLLNNTELLIESVRDTLLITNVITKEPTYDNNIFKIFKNDSELLLQIMYRNIFTKSLTYSENTLYYSNLNNSFFIRKSNFGIIELNDFIKFYKKYELV